MPVPQKEKKFERESAKQKVYETVKEWIIIGQLEPGEKIFDTEIADYLNVSRTPVREAFQMLESQKLIKSYPGKSTVVTQIETQNIEQLYLPMIELQGLAVSMAAERIKPKDIRKLRTLLKCFEKSGEEQDNLLAGLQADMNFHAYILQIADNGYVTDFCMTLWNHIQRLEYGYFQEEQLRQSVQEHEEIIEALESKECEKAVQLMRAHWQRTLSELKKTFFD